METRDRRGTRLIPPNPHGDSRETRAGITGAGFAGNWGENARKKPDSTESAWRFEGNTCGAGLKEGRAITRAWAHMTGFSGRWGWSVSIIRPRGVVDR